MKINNCFVLKTLLVALAFFVQIANAEQLIYATWNIRYANAKDSANGDGWGKRVSKIADVIHFYDFDIITVQEPNRNQVVDLANLLPEYDFVLTDSSYFHPIFFKKDVFRMSDFGTFWYSESGKPEKGWEASQIRFCSWVKLFVNGKALYVFNAHWDHKSWPARVESAKLTVKKIEKIAGNEMAIFSGDMNVEPNKGPYNTMQRSNVITDSRKIAKYVYAPNNSFNGFDVDGYGRWQIDYVFVSPNIPVEKYGILNERYYDEGKWRYPSDHLPVMVKLRME